MKNRIYAIFASGLLLLYSSVVLAHIGKSGGGLFAGMLHMLTGEHLLTLALFGLCVVVAVRHYRSTRR